MKTNLIPILFLAAALTACGPRGGEIPVLDVTASYPAKNITLQDVATVEYMPLETREGFLLDFVQVRYMDDEVIVSNNNAGDIIFFDRHTGKGLHSFNRKGRGPGEYTGVHGIAVDKAGGEMFVTPNSVSSYPYPMYVYDLEGKPLRTIGLKRGIQFPSFLHNYDAEHLFYRTDSRTPEVMGLLSKTDSLVTYLPVSLEGRENMTVYREEGSGENRVVFGNSAGNPIARTRDGLVLSEPGVDTMWRWRTASQELVPVMTRTPSWGSMEFPIGVFFMAESSDCMFVQTIERKYDFGTNEGFKKVNLIYDKRSGEFYEGGLVNADFADERSIEPRIMPGVPAGTFVAALQPYELIDLHETGKLRGRLAELAPTLKEDDNPVMMIVTFK